jgi:hypothetical protein
MMAPMASLEELEARVARLEQREQENRHVLGGRLDAIHYGIGQVHDTLHETRDELTAFRTATTERFDRIEDTLRQIVDRLGPA